MVIIRDNPVIQLSPLCKWSERFTKINMVNNAASQISLHRSRTNFMGNGYVVSVSLVLSCTVRTGRLD